jgi:hypothetical protein
MMGVVPLRIDVLTDISGVAFQEAWPRRSVADVAGVPANIIGLDDLIVNKRAAARDKDLIDVRRLVRRRDEKR